MILPLPHIDAMSPYALARMQEPENGQLVSLSQNESLRAPSPFAIAAATSALRSGQLYPDPDWAALREAIAGCHAVPAAQILMGNGSLDLIGCIARAYADHRNAILAPRHSYPFFRTATAFSGARFDQADETDLTVSVDNLLASVRPDTRIVFVANPGNPTGTRVPRSELLRLRAGLPGSVLLIVDEAYGEFTDHLNEPVFDLVDTGSTVVLRTFSKAYGLAGHRVGWGLFPPHVAATLRKLMNPNNVSAASQAAATAAVRDQTYMRETCAQTASLRNRACDGLKTIGLPVRESFTNFVLLEFGSPAAAQSADAALQQAGVFLRNQAGAGLPHCLRMTIGQNTDNELALHLIGDWLAGQIRNNATMASKGKQE